MRQGRSAKIVIVVALFLLVVGFAAVSAKLTFNGTAQLKGNSTEFDKNLRFVGDSDENKKATIVSSMNKEGITVQVSPNGKQLTFNTPVFDTINETATVSYYVENRGQYDAILGTITCTATSANQELVDYIEIDPSTNYNGLTLAAGTDATPTQTEEAATITVKLKKTYASDEIGSVAITCNLPATAKEN